ncbi:MAG: hypothetical protein A2V86_01510 [Deltaproteobacteria bacterium RBG_16_49_23]|nr:MAG: hypothetical protein A2V86_01510 [Deltaproteobacteria bacterium RBG_16_49_23]
MAYPTPACAEASAGRPTLPLPSPKRLRAGRLKGRVIAMVLLMKGKVIPTFLPLQGGGQEGDGEFIMVPLVSSNPGYG